LPHNRPAERLTGLSVPQEGRFALVCDADRRNVLPVPKHILDGLHLGKPNLLRIMFHPPRLREMLREFTLGDVANVTVVIDERAAATCGSLIEGEDVGAHDNEQDSKNAP
jgi:hypothetical protein